MFFSRKQNNTSTKDTEPISKLKYPKPKILLVDTDSEIAEKVTNEGFNAVEGKFGRVYKVQRKRNTFVQLVATESLPLNLSEMEIVVIDLFVKEIVDEPEGKAAFFNDQSPILVSTDAGQIDPRPHAMTLAAPSFAKVIKQNGVIIIFASPKVETIIYQQMSNAVGIVPTDSFDNWCFETDLKYLSVHQEFGTEIIVAQSSLSDLLRKHSKEAIFDCIFKPSSSLEDRFQVLATNKHDEPVAGVIFSKESEPKILIFPHFPDKTSFLIELFKDWLPALFPKLFPDAEKHHWIKKPEYELVQVTRLVQEINQVQEEAARRIAILQDKIAEEYKRDWYIQALLTETGRKLVEAVQTTLKAIGFQDVVDIDQTLKKGIKREDLQIKDNGRIVLVEVKGLNQTGTEADALQVSKNIAKQNQDLHRGDVRGLYILNQQRHLQPPDRNLMPFTDDTLISAEAYAIGFLTTWTLFRLIRNYQKLTWTHNQIAGLFYQNGFIEHIPLHYERVGKIIGIAKEGKAVGVNIEVSELKIGDRIAFEFDVEFEEQQIESMQIDNNPVESAGIGTDVGIGTNVKNLRKGLRVFRVQ